jgi:RimJ/RimL family protein N-acetyltransferase
MKTAASAVPKYALREFNLHDCAKLTISLNNSNITRYLRRVPEPYKDSDAREYISELIADAKMPNPIRYQRAIIVDQELVGCVGFDIETDQNSGMLGYWLAEEMWGRGIMTHAAGKMIDVAFSERSLQRLDAYTHVENTPSQKVLKKLGFEYVGEGTVQRWNGETIPVYKYDMKNPHYKICPMSPLSMFILAGMKSISPALRLEPDWIKFDHCVLRYLCFSKEAICGSSIEDYRVRTFVLKYFMEDKTVEVTETTDENSGLVGGTFFKRQQLLNSDQVVLPGPYLRCGSNVEIYSRVFRIVSMDDFTRDFYTRSNLDTGTEESVPEDPFKSRTVLSSTPARPLTLDLIREKALVNVLCGGTDLNRKVRQFIEQGHKILRFFCVWNDESEDGYTRYFSLHYFLADDTVEIIEKDKGLFFKRAILSKHGLAPVIADKYDERNNDIVTPRDLKTGMFLDIGGRKVWIYDCDKFTRDYYMDEFRMILEVFADPYKPVIRDKVETPRVVSQRPQIDDQVILRFQAILHNASRNHKDRRFIISAFPSDNTFSVYETAVRNSGFLAGKFAERAERENCTVSDFRVGSIIRASGTQFDITGCDEFTNKYLSYER